MREINLRIIGFFLCANFLFWGCNNGNVDDIQTPAETTPEAPAETTDNTLIDLSAFQLWDRESSFNKGTLEFKLNGGYKGGMYDVSKVDAADFKYICIEYSKMSDFLRVELQYSDDSSTKTWCAPYRNSAFIAVDPQRANKLKNLVLITEGNPVNAKLTKCYLTNEIDAAVVDSATTGHFNNALSSKEIVKNMGMGWNLANSLDCDTNNGEVIKGAFSELIWGNIVTTKEIIDCGFDYGYKTIRIPVTWYNHLIDDKYTIDPLWMARVKQVVDWAISKGYYVILDSHHDVHENMNSPLSYGEGYILRNNPTDIAESKAFLMAIWKQISAAFNNSYDEHLIFELMNEPRNTDSSVTHANGNHQWFPDSTTCAECKADYQIYADYMNLCINTIRASGGNNAKRFLMYSSLCGSSEEGIIGNEDFNKPSDTATDKLIGTFHSYPFTENGLQPDDIEFTEEIKGKIDVSILNAVKNLSDKGIPVVIGEYGTNKKNTASYNARKQAFTYMAELCGRYGISMLSWDGSEEDDGMGTIDRKTCSPYNPDHNEAILAGWEKGNKNKIDLGLYSLWDGSGTSTYDKNSYRLEIDGNYHGGTLYLGQQPVLGDKLIFEYTELTGSIKVSITYSEDVSSSNYSVPSGSISLEIPVDKNKKIEKIDIMTANENAAIIDLQALYFE